MNFRVDRLRPRLICLGITCFVLLGCCNAAVGNPHTKSGVSVARLGRPFNLRVSTSSDAEG